MRIGVGEWTFKALSTEQNHEAMTFAWFYDDLSVPDFFNLLGKERTEFFATLSHEFRTPLAIIRTQADMLTDPELRRDAAAATT